MGEAGRTGRVQRLLNRETRELIVFRSSSTTVGESSVPGMDLGCECSFVVDVHQHN